jgi:hypothetical protein
MEDFFAPSTRLRDLYHAREPDDEDEDNDGDEDDESSIDSSTEREMNSLVELELVTGSSAEDILLYREFKWGDFYSWARGKIVWISPHVFFDLTGSFDIMDFESDYRFFLAVGIVPNEEDTSEESKSLYLCASSTAHSTVASYILLQLLTTCESREVSLRAHCEFQIPGLAFSHFLVQSHNLRVLRLHNRRLDTCHCRAMDALTRTDLQIDLIDCQPTESGKIVLLESIRQNRGPTQLSRCRIDTRGLADALRGNSSVSSLSPHLRYSDQDRLVLVQALAETEGLVTLHLDIVPITDTIWIALWRSVARHPTLEKIVLPHRTDFTWKDGTTDAQQTLRMQAMVDALRINTVLHTVELNRDHFDQEILDSTVYPLLLANRYRPRVRAIAKKKGPGRRMLLGRALGSVSSDPSLIWMFLSGNANVRLGRIPPKRKRAPNSDEGQGPPVN